MQSFYEDVVGLPLMERFPKAAFFRVGEGVGGHTQVFVLFDRGDATSARPAGTTLDHVAFTVLREHFEAERARVERLGLPVQTAEHRWVQWRSFYVKDPEDNEVEWVCYDPDVAPESNT